MMCCRYIYLIIITMFIFSGCSKKQNPEIDKKTMSAKGSNVSEITNVRKREPLVPNFSWTDKDGKVTDFDSFRGKVTLVNFWATWCGPCKRELPDLISLSKEMAERNIKVLGISTDRGTNVVEEVRSFVAEKSIPYQIVISNEELEEAFGNIRVIPTTFLVDAEGKIVQTIVGGRSKDQFADAINALLK